MSLKGYLQKRFINWIVRDLFNTITAEDILQSKGNDLYLRGKKLDRETVEALSNDAEKYQASNLVKLETNQLRFLANQKMYENSKTPEDMIAGKMILFALEQQKKFREFLRNLK